VKKLTGVLCGFGLLVSAGTAFAEEETAWVPTSCKGEVEVTQSAASSGAMTVATKVSFTKLTPACSVLEKHWGLFSKFQGETHTARIIGNPNPELAAKIATKLRGASQEFVADIGVKTDSQKGLVEAISIHLSPAGKRIKSEPNQTMTLAAKEVQVNSKAMGGGSRLIDIGYATVAFNHEIETR